MIQKIGLRKQISRMLACLTVIICCRAGLMAQNRSQPDPPKRDTTLHVTHILGFEGVSNNAQGELSIQGDALQFRKAQAAPPAQIAVDSIQDVTIGAEDKQVGGVPMTLVKTAAPYGGGRVMSLFAHKTFDTVTLEYLDANRGFHGVIFQLSKGQGQVLGSELEAKGVHVSVL